MKIHSSVLTLIILVLIVTAGILCLGQNPYTFLVTNILNSGSKCIVIDPGHGGYDPGKVGVDNTLEKDINLSIALKLKDVLEKNNYQVVMTRSEDIDYSSNGSGSKKTNDLNSRINIINEASPAIVISIHQNSFHDSSVSGAQVFYYGDAVSSRSSSYSPASNSVSTSRTGSVSGSAINPGDCSSGNTEGSSHMLANSIQDALINELDKSNHRVAKSNTSYYMLKKTSYPTVIVECGFLSNPEETKNLNDSAYQQKTAQAIYCGIENYFNQL